jgi:hypothetical protein
MIKRSLFSLPALHARRQSSNYTLGLVLRLYLTTLPSALKHLGKRASCMAPPNAFGPGPSGLRLPPSRSSRPMRRGFHAHHQPLVGVVGAPEVLTGRLVGLTSHMMRSSPTKKPFPPLEPLGSLLSPVLGTDGGQNGGLDLMLQGALRLLHDGSTEDAF